MPWEPDWNMDQLAVNQRCILGCSHQDELANQIRKVQRDLLRDYFPHREAVNVNLLHPRASILAVADRLFSSFVTRFEQFMP